MAPLGLTVADPNAVTIGAATLTMVPLGYKAWDNYMQSFPRAQEEAMHAGEVLIREIDKYPGPEAALSI